MSFESAGPTTGSTVSAALIIVAAIASAPALRVALYVLPAALVDIAWIGRTTDGFAFGQLRPVLMSDTCAVAWLLTFGVTVAVVSVGCGDSSADGRR